MTPLLRAHLSRLAGTIADLKDRVRAAVAGELGRAVSGAVQQVVQAVVSGRADPPRTVPPSTYYRPASSRWDDEDDGRWDRPGDPWADDSDDDYHPGGRPAAPARPDAPQTGLTPAHTGVAAAVAAGVAAAKLWLARRGTALAAAGVGLGVGLLGVLGGPAARTAVAVLAGAADLLAAADALGAGAARLDQL